VIFRKRCKIQKELECKNTVIIKTNLFIFLLCDNYNLFSFIIYTKTNQNKIFHLILSLQFFNLLLLLDILGFIFSSSLVLRAKTLRILFLFYFFHLSIVFSEILKITFGRRCNKIFSIICLLNYLRKKIA